jgi:glycosyltransferase involved in cell wall biosynthesis
MPRVALVHDFLLDLRGAERAFAAICDRWPDADIFTAVYDEAGTEGRFADRRVHTSFLQRLRPTARTFRVLLPLYPNAIESLDLRGYDVVISSSSAWAHGVLVEPGAVHVSYCYNPFRYAWSEREATLAARNPITRPVLRALLARWRQWDWIAAQRVDRYVSISELTALRIARYLGRDSDILYPPVETARFWPGEVGDHYLVLAELMPHKRIEVAVRAFNAIGRKLVVAGDGPEYRRLRRLAGPTISFEGRVTDERAADLLRSCRALVVTATEEFGIAAVEAHASGRPVIALDEGGVRETVTPGVTGAFFATPTAQALADAVTGFDDAAVDPEACVASAQRFTVERFQSELARIVDETRAAERQPRPVERTPGGLVRPRRVRTRNEPSRRSGA